MNTEILKREHRDYPAYLSQRLGAKAPDCLYYRGDISILRKRLLGFVCSIQCPGNIIIKTLDAARILKDKGFSVVGGFHSPMEAEVLEILMKGKQPIVVSPSRGLKGCRIGKEAQKAIDEQRLLLLSLFPDTITRKTEELSVMRNDFVASLAEGVWVPYASPNGKTWKTVHEVIGRGQTVYTFNVEENGKLISFGAFDITNLFYEITD